MSNIISSLGAGSGIDTTGLIKGLVEAERLPVETRLDSKQNNVETQISAYGRLKSALATFQGLLVPLRSNDTFNARTVAFPETNIVTPNSIDAGAQPGTYQVLVEEVARAQTLTSQVFAEKNAALGASGTLSIQFGAWDYDATDTPLSLEVNDKLAVLDIEVVATDTLQTLATKINDAKADIQASVLEIDGQYQLMLNAPSGTSNALRITSDNASLSAFEFNETTASMSETQRGLDAVIYVNGIEVTRETNEIDDVIPGFSFTLNKKAANEELTFTIEEDKSTSQQAVRDFVEGYNNLFTVIDGLVGYTRDEETNELVKGGLATDGTAKTLVSQLRSMIGNSIPGVDDGFTALTNIGIRTELNGQLAIDEDDFSAGFSENYSLVQRLFASTLESENPYVQVKTGSYSQNTVPGVYSLTIGSDPSKGKLQANQITHPNFDPLTHEVGEASSVNTSLGDFSFKIKVDGVESNTITLSGDYSSIEDLRADLQSQINGDENLKAARAAVDISFDITNDGFIFVSREYGSTSKVSFTEVSTDAQSLGLNTTITGTAGVDVAGSIDGTNGFGSGNVLLPNLESDLYGLNFTITPGASAVGTSSFTYSRGFAGEMDSLITAFLSKSGTISRREERLNAQLGEIRDDRKDLETKMRAYEEKLTSQFIAMERIISSLNATGSALDGILDRLPFTSQKG